MSIARKLAVTTASVAIFATVASGVAFAQLEKIVGDLHVQDISNQTGHKTEEIAAEPGKPMNLVVIGSDTRDGQGGGYGGSQLLGSQRSDTTLLVHISGDRQWATAVSIPRDLYIAMPDCKRPDGSISKGWSDKFNAAFSRAGAACTIVTLEQMTGLTIDHYLVVNFTGFRHIVNAVGGVDVCVTDAVNDVKSHLVLPKGWSTLDGKQAIAFVRARKTLGDGSDTSRIRRQQDFLASLAKKMLSAGTLLNPLKLNNVLSAVAKSVTTDISSVDQLKQLAINMSDLKLSNIRFITAPSGPDPDHPADVKLTSEADQLWASLKSDTRWPAPPDTGLDGKELTKPIDEITVRVLNGTTTNGLAGDKAALLSALGYKIDKVDNADPKLWGTETAVFAAKTKYNAARTVAKSLGLNVIKPLPAGSDFKLVVVVGKKWTDPVSVKTKPAASTAIYAPTEGRAADETTCSPA